MRCDRHHTRLGDLPKLFGGQLDRWPKLRVGARGDEQFQPRLEQRPLQGLPDPVAEGFNGILIRTDQRHLRVIGGHHGRAQALDRRPDQEGFRGEVMHLGTARQPGSVAHQRRGQAPVSDLGETPDCRFQKPILGRPAPTLLGAPHKGRRRGLD